ncbi:Rossmann fold domain-containing protein [uncultured Sphingomonas sp.]|uniref:Rossmann fold domain-containing protein n=1 Tax=Sphingomonas sp. TaxID=28214 RepID=UPI0026215324|nr:hypothetical protein [uncultured Sphingomonas sp.]
MRIDVHPDDDVAGLVRGTQGESVVLVILPGRDALAQAVALAAIGPLAIERAPDRINAVVSGEGAEPGAVDAAVAFLDAAPSTTGQVLTVGA